MQKNISESSVGVCTTIVSFEEQMRGWLGIISKAKAVQQEIFAYKKLNGFLDNFRNLFVLEFDEKAA